MKAIATELKNAGLIILAIFSAAFGLKGFLLSSRFIDGGVTGISMLTSDVTGVPLAILIPVFNLPFVVIAYRQVGWKFALRTTLAIAGLALCLAVVKFPDVTPDKLLTAVFGGFFIGAGIGLAIRGSAVLDGTEIAALLISRSISVLKVGDVILLLNLAIFLAAAGFLGVESAMYSILTYFAASKTIDFLVYGLEEYHAITVISKKSEAIRQAILIGLRRGVTIYQGKGGRSGDSRDILFCVVTRLEIGRIKSIVRAEDPKAFLVVHSLADVEGGFVKRSAFH